MVPDYQPEANKDVAEVTSDADGSATPRSRPLRKLSKNGVAQLNVAPEVPLRSPSRNRVVEVGSDVLPAKNPARNRASDLGPLITNAVKSPKVEVEEQLSPKTVSERRDWTEVVESRLGRVEENGPVLRQENRSESIVRAVSSDSKGINGQ